MPNRITTFNAEAIRKCHQEWIKDGKVVIPEIPMTEEGPLRLISITPEEFLERLSFIENSTSLGMQYKEKVEWLLSNHISHEPGIGVEELLKAAETILTYATTSHLTSVMKMDTENLDEIKENDQAIENSPMGQWLCSMQHRAKCHMIGRECDE